QARGSSNFNQGTALEVEFSAMPAGIAGNGITLAFTQVNLGLAAAPRITLNGRTLNIQLNSTPGSETTAAALVTAINTDPVANQLVRARLTVGQGSTRVTSSQNIAPVTLTGANDVVLTPGFVGLGAT